MSGRLHKLTIVVALAPSLLAPAAAQTEHLHSPWDDHAIAATDDSYQCPATPEFAKILDAQPYYTDAHASVVDPAKKAAYEKASEGPTHLGQFAGLAADAYLAKGSRAAAACVYSLLDAAAKADAWAGEMPHFQDVYAQNWMLSGTAIPYLKVRNSGMGTPQQDAEIQQWFHHLAQRVQTYFDKGKGHPKTDAYNNHLYWAGLALAAEGVADNDQSAFLWGIATYYQGVGLIQSDGSLAAEMNRAGMALHYQLYALAPLIMLAELGEANGVDMYNVNHGAIHRLVKFDLAAMQDPAIIAKRTGVPQNTSAPYSGNEIGWAVPYVKRLPDAQLSALLASAPWVRFWQWGGAPPEPEIPRPSRAAERSAFEANLQSTVNAAMAEQFPHNPSQAAGFLGEWCGQGIHGMRASITDSGPYLTLTNENGDASTGRVDDKGKIVAPGWQNVTGSLNPSGIQIDWSNGTYWERCDAARGDADRGDGDRRPLNLAGKWFPQGNLSRPCMIRQQSSDLHIECVELATTNGRIDGAAHFTIKWGARSIGATVTADHNHIHWDDQTYWTRSTLYESASK
jgi:poly(beta-D-mannuronate) lyase